MADDRNKVIGNRIRQARELRGLTQQYVADLIGKTASTISSYESGSRMISVSDLPNLATALHMPISYFFGEINPASELASIYDDLPTDDQIRLLEFARMLLRLTQDS